MTHKRLMRVIEGRGLQRCTPPQRSWARTKERMLHYTSRTKRERGRFHYCPKRTPWKGESIGSCSLLCSPTEMKRSERAPVVSRSVKSHRHGFLSIVPPSSLFSRHRHPLILLEILYTQHQFLVLFDNVTESRTL